MFILPVQGKVKKYQNMQRQKREARDSISNNVSESFNCEMKRIHLFFNKQIRDEKLPNGASSNMFGDCFGKENENHV